VVSDQNGGKTWRAPDLAAQAYCNLGGAPTQRGRMCRAVDNRC
jgi:hypothetical protein